MTKSQKSRFEVAVTQADIDKALVNNSAKCVVAQAIARTLPNAHRIDVDTQTIRFTMDGERFAYLTPYSVMGYVIAFDAGDPIEPFRFRLYDDRKVPVRQRLRTPAGLAKNKAQDKARRAKRAAVQAQSELETVLAPQGELAPPTAAQVEEIRAKAKAAKASATVAFEAAKAAAAANPGPVVEPSTQGRDVKRVFKTNERHYGHRALRINQADLS